ncbi:MAG: hypothetical protein AABY32_01435 [Nanoarchaeota archaeon]
MARVNASSKVVVDIMEGVIRGFFTGGATPTEFVAAVNNAFFHGEIIEEDYNLGEKNDEYLGEFYDGIEKMSSAAKKMEK